MKSRVAELRASVRRRPVLAGLGVAAACGLILVAVGGSDRSAGSENRDQLGPGAVLGLVRGLAPLSRLDIRPAAPEPPRVPGPSFTIAQVLPGERVSLHERPGGPVLATATDSTEFGSLRSFAVRRRSGEWLGVPVPERPNGRLAWIRNDSGTLRFYETPFHVVADVSRRSLELRYGKRLLERFSVTVGAPGSPTPTGTYAVTDGLAGRGVGPYYGCCVLALTGHQPYLPPDWLGGDRIAIHGTPGEIGIAASAGCLRASDVDMVSLFARVPLGAPVFIRA